MERNNGSKSTGKNNPIMTKEQIENLINENEALRERLKEAYERMKGYNDTILITRATLLFKIIETKAFDKETENKAKEELKAFMFPKQLDENANK